MRKQILASTEQLNTDISFSLKKRNIRFSTTTKILDELYKGFRVIISLDGDPGDILEITLLMWDNRTKCY